MPLFSFNYGGGEATFCLKTVPALGKIANNL